MSVSASIAASHTAVTATLATRRCTTCIGCTNFTSLSVSTQRMIVTTMFTHCGLRSRKNVGATRFQIAGKPRNQWSSVIRSLRANHRTAVKRIAAHRITVQPDGKVWKYAMNATGSITHVR